jgi:hypothetical protein
MCTTVISTTVVVITSYCGCRQKFPPPLYSATAKILYALVKGKYDTFYHTKYIMIQVRM